MGQKAYSDILPSYSWDILPRVTRHPAFVFGGHPASRDATSCLDPYGTSCLLPLVSFACLQAHQLLVRRRETMVSKDPQSTKRSSSATPSDPAPATNTRRRQTKGTSRKVTEARATAQRAKLDAQAQERQRKTELAQKEGKARPSQGKHDQQDLL